MRLPKRHLLLIGEATQSVRELIKALETGGHAVSTAQGKQDAFAQLRANEVHVILLSPHKSIEDRMAFLRALVDRQLDTPVILLPAPEAIHAAVEAMRFGVLDIVESPVAPATLYELLAQILEYLQRGELESLEYEIHLDLTQREIEQGQLAAAAGHVRRAIAADPSRPEAFNLLGALYQMTGDRHEALKYYRVALDLDPSYEPARDNLLDTQGMPEEIDIPNLGKRFSHPSSDTSV